MVDTPEVKETYNVPGIGFVRIVYAPKDNCNGPFYASIEPENIPGTISILATRSNSQKQALSSIAGSVRCFLSLNKATLEDKLEDVSKALSLIQASYCLEELPKQFKVDNDRTQ
jgi:hypothetical protein